MIGAFRHGRWVLSVAVVLALTGCDWTAVGFGPANTNFNPLEPALTESSVQHLQVAWSAPCACGGRALVAGGPVYGIDGYTGAAPDSLTLRAFDSVSGKRRWSTRLGTSALGDALSAVANGLVYVVVGPYASTGRLVAFDARTGRMRWGWRPRGSGTGTGVVVIPTIDERR